MQLQRLLLLVCFLVLSTLVIPTLQKSCQNLTKDELYHSRSFVRDTCGPNDTYFTPEEISLIVDNTNSMRSMPIPQATNQREIVWDKDLAENARKHAMACTGAHSNRTMVKYYSGNQNETWSDMAENLCYMYGNKYNVCECNWLFFLEGAKYDITTHNCTHPQTCGHYIAMMNAAHTKMGCAKALCPSFTMSNYPTPAVLLVCQYNAATYDYPPYKVGPQGSDCTLAKSGYSGQFKRYGLCISPGMKFTNSGYTGDVKTMDVNCENAY